MKIFRFSLEIQFGAPSILLRGWRPNVLERKKRQGSPSRGGSRCVTV
jgi:hypothetical protein